MYESLTEFLKTFSTSHSVLWALLIMGVMATTSLALYAFWEVALKTLFSGVSRARNRAGKYAGEQEGGRR